MDYQKITYTVEEGIAVIAMACKENLNALDMQMGAELLDAIRNAETNDEVKVLVIKGLERSFSAVAMWGCSMVSSNRASRWTWQP